MVPLLQLLAEKRQVRTNPAMNYLLCSLPAVVKYKEHNCLDVIQMAGTQLDDRRCPKSEALECRREHGAQCRSMFDCQ